MINQIQGRLESQSSLVITGEDIPFGAYQAIYHKLTKRIETDRHAYDDAFDISIIDIVNLHDRVTQLLKQYQIRALRCEVTHELKDDSTRQHSSFEKFKISDCSLRACTTALNYELDFLIILPPEVPEASEIAQRYKLNLVFDQDFIENNDFNAPYFIRNMVIGNNVTLSVEYADYAVYKALRATVDGWVATLPTRKSSGTINFFRKFERGILHNVPNLARLGAYAGAAVFAYDHQSANPATAAIIVIVGSGIAVTGSLFTGYLIDVFFKLLNRFKPSTRLSITTGDIERIQKTIKEGSRLTALTGFVGVAVFLSVALNVLSSFIYDKLLK